MFEITYWSVSYILKVNYSDKNNIFDHMIETAINGYKLEICANSFYSATQAELGGASRVELCQNLENGGTTPSYGQIKLTREALGIGVHVLIRPRSGDFLYTEQEISEMGEDILFCKSIGCDGVVIGVLTAEGEVDKIQMQKLVNMAKPMTVVFHRAFDRCVHPFKALEDIIALGCDRILTSGQEDSALKGKQLLKDLIEKSRGRIEIMPGAGVEENNLQEILQFTRAKSIHSSAKEVSRSKMIFNNKRVNGMDEDQTVSSIEKISKLVEKIKSL